MPDMVIEMMMIDPEDRNGKESDSETYELRQNRFQC